MRRPAPEVIATAASSRDAGLVSARTRLLVVVRVGAWISFLHNCDVIDNEGTVALETALRVLTSLTNRVQPAECDVVELRRLTPERLHDPIDEIACDLVHRLLEARAAARTAAG